VIVALRRLAFLAPSVFIIALVPEPDRPWPLWLFPLVSLASARVAVGFERLHGRPDFVLSLPFLGLAIVGAARFSFVEGAGLLGLAAETLVGTVLLACLSELLDGRLGLAYAAAAGLALLGALSWIWAVLPPVLAVPLETVVALVAMRAIMRIHSR
jgi:hypothetical protein